MIDTGPNRPGVQTYTTERGERIVELRISKLGDCPRAIAAVIMGEKEPPPSEQLMTSAQEGHLHEAAVAERLSTEFRMELHDQQGECVAEYDDVLGFTFVLRGRYEGIWYVGGEPVFAWENKAKSENQFKEWMKALDGDTPTFAKHPGHAWQISQYMHCHGLPVMYTVKNRNTGELHTSWVRQAPYTGLQIRARLESIIRIVQGGPQALWDNSHCDPGLSAYMCPFRDQLSCLRKPTDLTGTEEVDDYELDGWLMAYVSHRNDEARAKKAKEDLGKEIKKRVGSGKVVTPNQYTANVYPVNRVDMDAVKAFLAEHGKTIEDFHKPSDQLSVRAPKGFG